MKKKGYKKLQFILNQRDEILLEKYAALNNIGRNKAAKRILHEYLKENVTMPENIPENQLDLFSDKETDIFDFIKS